jgi:uncharacterized protein YqgV (UPF0045/DUF77 family)
MNYSIENKTKLESQFSRIKSLCEKRGAVDILKDVNQLESMVFNAAEENSLPVSAQLSIYPLRKPSLSMTIDAALRVMKDSGLKLIPGSMSTLILGEANQIWKALEKVFSEASEQGEVVMIVTMSNACPKPQE